LPGQCGCAELSFCERTLRIQQMAAWVSWRMGVPVDAKKIAWSVSARDSCSGIGDIVWQFVLFSSFDTQFVLKPKDSGGGEGELYTYLPLTQNNEDVLSKVPPGLLKNGRYGYEVGRGSWNFSNGTWTTIAQYVHLNDPDKINGAAAYSPANHMIIERAIGEVQVWINGIMVMNIKRLQMRNSSASVFAGMHFQTSFGGSLHNFEKKFSLLIACLNGVDVGSTPDHASPKAQKAWFADVSGAIVYYQPAHLRPKPGPSAIAPDLLPCCPNGHIFRVL
jgi:hypothetical protein